MKPEIKRLGNKLYEKVCSCLLVGKIIFYPQKSMKVSKTKIDKRNNINRPKQSFLTSEAIERDRLFTIRKNKAIIERRRIDKELSWQQKMIYFYEVDLPIMYNIIEEIFKCSDKQEHKDLTKVVSLKV